MKLEPSSLTASKRTVNTLLMQAFREAFNGLWIMKGFNKRFEVRTVHIDPNISQITHSTALVKVYNILRKYLAILISFPKPPTKTSQHVCC